MNTKLATVFLFMPLLAAACSSTEISPVDNGPSVDATPPQDLHSVADADVSPPPLDPGSPPTDPGVSPDQATHQDQIGPSFERAKIYVAVVMHNEEPLSGQYPDFVNALPLGADFQEHRSRVVKFANMLYDEGVKFDYQSDWNFLEAMKLYDDGTDTNGKNLLRWLVEDKGFQVDPHAHETSYNYADVAYLNTELLGIPATGVVGGFIYYPISDSILEQFFEPISGDIFDTSWQATILWGAATYLHQGNDEKVSGVWSPKSSTEFFVHDPNRIPYVGGYLKGSGGVEMLLNLSNQGELDPNKIYTTTLNTTHKHMTTDQEIEEFRAGIQSIKAKDVHGQVRWVTMNQLIEDWKTIYKSEPNYLFAPNFTPNPEQAP